MIDARTSKPAAAAQIVSRTLKYRDSQEHLVRRLGNALLLHWDHLPDALQDVIIDQAAIVEDREEAPHQIADVEAFVRTAKSVAIAKATETER